MGPNPSQNTQLQIAAAIWQKPASSHSIVQKHKQHF